MGLKIIKLAVLSDSKLSNLPTVSRFFYEVQEPISEISTLKIDASHFIDDTGNEAVSLPTLNINNSYFNVFINGVLQMDDNFAYTAGEKGIGNLLIFLPKGSEIALGTPIILEVINFHPQIQTIVET